MRSGRSSSFWVLALAAQFAVAALIVLSLPTSQLNHARLIIVAPPVVSTALVADAAGLEGEPFEATALTSVDEAMRALSRGQTDAVVEVDLLDDADHLYVSEAASADGVTLIADAVRGFESALGRSMTTEVVPIDEPRWLSYLLVGVAMLIGFGAAVVAVWQRGTFATTARAGLRRILWFAFIAGACGGVVALFTGSSTGVLFAAVTLAAATTTTVLTAFMGVFGLAFATLTFILTAAPLGLLIPLMLLPGPWQTVTTYLLHGAGLEVAQQTVLFGYWGSWQAWAIVVAWILIPLLGLLAIRQLRPSELAATSSSRHPQPDPR